MAPAPGTAHALGSNPMATTTELREPSSVTALEIRELRLEDLERFARTGNAYSVEQALRSPTPRLFHTHIQVTPAADLTTMSYMQHRIGSTADAPLIANTDVKVTGDSASLQTREPVRARHGGPVDVGTRVPQSARASRYGSLPERLHGRRLPNLVGRFLRNSCAAAFG